MSSSAQNDNSVFASPTEEIPDSDPNNPTSAAGGNPVPNDVSAVTESPLSHISSLPDVKESVQPTSAQSSTKSAQTLHFVGFRHQLPIATVMIQEPVYFCGPNYDLETRSWSTYHPLPRDGQFNINDQHLRAIVPGGNDLKVKAALEKAAVFGEAAGRIYVRWMQRSDITTTVELKCMALSGFFLEKDLIVSSARWLKKVHEAPSRKAVMHELMDPTQSRIIVSDRDCSVVASDPLKYSAYLWRFDSASDIAIFRIPSARDYRKPAIELIQLGLAPSDRSTFPVWTVAYSCQDSGLGTAHGIAFTNKEKVFQEARYNAVMLKYPTTIFEYMAYGYFDSLAATNKGCYIIGTIPPGEASKVDHPHQTSTASIFDLTNIMPIFSTLFKHGQKALAVGQVLSRDDELLTGPISDREDQREMPKYSQQRVHTISGYFGCSGAMIATLDEMDNPKVIGIFNGGDERPMNVFTAFTEAGIGWIADAIADSNKLNAATSI